MDENLYKEVLEDKQIPYMAFEGVQARHERTVKRLIVALIIVTAMMFCSNIAWLYAWQQYDYESEEAELTYTFTQDSRGLNNINMGNQGDIRNGSDRENN